MGLTGGVKSHRLSGQISPYCEKKTSLALRVLRAYVYINVFWMSVMGSTAHPMSSARAVSPALFTFLFS